MIGDTDLTILHQAGVLKLSGSTWTVDVDPLALDGGSSDVCGIARRELSKSLFTFADYLNSDSHTVTMTVYDSSGNSDSCSITLSLEMPPEPFLQFPNPVQMYNPFSASWPVLYFFSNDLYMDVHMEHPSDSNIRYAFYEGLYGNGSINFVPQHMFPNIYYDLNVKLGDYPKFLGGKVRVNIR